MQGKESSVKDLRKFAITLFCALGILGGLFLWRKGDLGFLFWCIGVMILLAGLIRPGLLRPIQRGWMRAALLIGFFMTHLILALIYYLVFTPVGLVMRALGRDPLRLKFDQNAESYWIKKEHTGFGRERYERMF
ncbi:MAG: hypothetical protein GTO24_23360 [candidate division Zixibacteria bacterium]|nr:hypothetical protein [candidate division Zixibacteria bacterium]